jgi:fructosamine-3-kinase
LSRSKTVTVPQVLAVGSDRDYSFLVMEYLPPVRWMPITPSSSANSSRLHQWSDQPQFGLDFDNDLSTTPQPNAWQRRWSTFFAEQRIGWQLELAAEKGLEFGNIDAIVEHVQQRLASHQPQASLLHGDLWSETARWGPTARISLTRPATGTESAILPCCRHPEQPPQIYDGISLFPLPPGFLERQPVYQLYTLMNRAILFGGEHLVNAQRALERVLAA